MRRAVNGRDPVLWLVGADEAILARCPSERVKFGALAATIVVTAVFATVSAIFAAHQFLHVPVFLAVVIGLGWGTAILALDRWMVVSIRRQSTALRTLALAAPRVALAIVAGIVIAEPIVLRVFESEVNAQATRDRQAALADGKHSLQVDYAEIPKLETERTTLERELIEVDSGAVLAGNAEYQTARADADRLDEKALAAERSALCELDGTCGTSRNGAGPVYAKKRRVAADRRTRADAARAQLARLRQRLLGQERSKAGQADTFRRDRLGRVRDRLSQLKSERGAAESRLREAYEKPIGLLDRIEALGVLSKKHPSMGAASLLLSLLILLLDSAPALGKALMSLGRPSLYERIQDEEETRAHGTVEAERLVQEEILGAQHDAARARRQAEEAACEIEVGFLVEQAKMQREAEREGLRVYLQEESETLAHARRLFLDRWRAEILDAVPDLVDEELERTPPEVRITPRRRRYFANGAGPRG